MAFSAFPLSFASPFHLCANFQRSMTFKLPFFYGFLNSAFILKSRRQRHITPINLYLLNSCSIKKLFNNNFTTSQFKRSSHSSGFHLQVSTSIEVVASEEQEFQVTDAREISDSEDPIDREDDKYDTQQTPSNKPKVRECNMKLLLQEVVVTEDYKRNNAGGSKTVDVAPDGKKAGIQRCKELMRDRALQNRIRAKVLHAEKEELLKVAKTRFASYYTLLRCLLDCREQLVTIACLSKWKDLVKNADASTGAKVADTIKNDEFWDDVENIVRITKSLFLLIKFCDEEGPKISRGVERKPPNLDSEVMLGVLEAFRKITESKEEKKLLREQYAVFHQRKRGLFAKLACQEDAVPMDPIDWWSTYGSETPELGEVAKKVLSQPVSSSSAERNWSTYSYIHNVKRNRLNNARADKLVFIHSNIRLLSRFSKSYTSEPYKYWDIDPETSTMEESITRMQELMWSIDNEEDSNSAKL
ncbi:hypothetical protein Cgig2_010200 [Carnegiea gigantea]|uniref:HAT C-terminal dimerisation domain-containing protein n=1 Tax=Carnegiea gigantea TaxID=171969 RepID=A0A9Q1JNB1_9CARY|nr:hypothetical protein Cgig2_010200 [Carnegiea gigantea]